MLRCNCFKIVIISQPEATAAVTSTTPSGCSYIFTQKSQNKQGHQARGLTAILCMQNEMAVMSSCFGFARTHQHGRHSCTLRS